MAERGKLRSKRIAGVTAKDVVDDLKAMADGAMSRGNPGEIRKTAAILEKAALGLPVNARSAVTNRAASMRLQASTAQGIAENQRKFAAGLETKGRRRTNLTRGVENVATRLEALRQPGVLGQTSQPLDLKDPQIATPLAQLKAARTAGPARRASQQLKAGVGALQSGKGRNIGLKRAGLGGLAAGGLGLLLPSLFGKKEPTIDPAVQMALAQQLGGGGQGTTGTLRDVARLLSILKSIQGMAGMQGPQAQGRPRLI